MDSSERDSDEFENEYVYNFTDAQVTVDQHHIIVTFNGSNWLFRHPAVRHIKGTFSSITRRGCFFFDPIMNMYRAPDGTLHDHQSATVKFVFHNVTQWYNFYQELEAWNYTSPPSEFSNLFA